VRSVAGNIRTGTTVENYGIKLSAQLSKLHRDRGLGPMVGRVSVSNIVKNFGML
jgi:hypothetical protein